MLGVVVVRVPCMSFHQLAVDDCSRELGRMTSTTEYVGAELACSRLPHALSSFASTRVDAQTPITLTKPSTSFILAPSPTERLASRDACRFAVEGGKCQLVALMLKGSRGVLTAWNPDLMACTDLVEPQDSQVMKKRGAARRQRFCWCTRYDLARAGS